MARMDVEWISGGMKSRHGWIAAVAILVSVALHIAAYWRMPDFALGMPTPTRGIERMAPVRIIDNTPEIKPVTVPPEWFEPSAHSAAVGVGTGFAPGTDIPVETTDPRPTLSEDLAGDAGALADPPTVEMPTVEWTPRAEILQIDRTIVPDDVTLQPRQMIPDIARVADAPDIALPVERLVTDTAPPLQPVDVPRPDVGPAQVPIAMVEIDVPDSVPIADSVADTVTEDEAAVAEVSDAVTETYTEVTEVEAVEDLLMANVRIYESRRDPDYGYFELRIDRKDDEVLPVIPRDIVFVQDCSASMSEQRLYFCRQGIKKALPLLDPKDRFNILAFRDKTEKAFPKLVECSQANIEQAGAYVSELKAFGETDIYASVRALLDLPHTPGRPMIVLLITDGLPTTGLTDSSLIIENFSRANQAQRSIFTVGTLSKANQYLLDLLSYRNRGDSLVVGSGRWDIPDTIAARARSLTRPVMSDMRLRFTDEDRCQVYPRLTTNLYIDRPLILHGRYARGMKEITFQVAGHAGEKTCDMIFRIDLEAARKGKAEIRENWAWQNVYHLIGEHTRTRSPKTMTAIRTSAKAYGITVPYRDRF